MRDPNLKSLTLYVSQDVYDTAVRAAKADGRSVTNYLARLVATCMQRDQAAQQAGKRTIAKTRASRTAQHRTAVGDLAKDADAYFDRMGGDDQAQQK